MVKTTEFNVQTQMNYVVGNMSGFTTAYVGMDNLSALISSLMTSYTTLAGTGRAAYMTLGASVAAFGLKSAEAFGEYERGMNIVKAISNNTNAQMQILSQTANQFSTQFRMDISEINDGLVTLGRAGLTNVNNQIQVLQNGLKVAKLEGMNLAATLEDIVTTTSLLGGDVTKNDFGADSSKVSNLLIATSLSGPLDVGDVIETLKFAGGSAAAAGANLNNEEGLKDLLGTIGAFSQKGVIGSIAGTALRAFITKPASQDKTVKDALAELGLDAYSLWEKDEENGWQMKPIAEQIGMITKAMDKQHMTNLDRIEVWGDIVGNKMGQQMLKLDENRIKEVTKQIDHQRNLDEIYQGTLTNFASQVERLNQVFQSMYRNLGSGFASSLTGIVQHVADLLDFINGFGNGVLIKILAPILGTYGLMGLAKGLRDVVEIINMLRQNIRQSAEKRIKSQPLYRPYEEWEEGSKSRSASYGGYGGYQSGERGGYKSDRVPFVLPSDYKPQETILNDELRQKNLKILQSIERNMGLAIDENPLTKVLKQSVFLKQNHGYSDEELATLRDYEMKNRIANYIGGVLGRQGLLFKDNEEKREFTPYAKGKLMQALGITDPDVMNKVHVYAKDEAAMIMKEYGVSPADSKYESMIVDGVVRRLQASLYRHQMAGKGSGSLYDLAKKGMNTDEFDSFIRKQKEPYLQLKEEFEKDVKAGRLKEGTSEYRERFSALDKLEKETTNRVNGIKSASIMNRLSMSLQDPTMMPQMFERVNTLLSDMKIDPQTKMDISGIKQSIDRIERAVSSAKNSKLPMDKDGRVYQGLNNVPLEKEPIYGDQSDRAIAIDVEGTGKRPSKHAIMQIGAALVEGDQYLKGFLTGYTDEELRPEGKMTISQAYDHFANEITSKFDQEKRKIMAIPEDVHPTKGALKVNKLGPAYEEEGRAVIPEVQELLRFQNFLFEAASEAAQAGERIKIVAHNGKYDIEMLANAIDRVKQSGVEGSEKLLEFYRMFQLFDTLGLSTADQSRLLLNYGVPTNTSAITSRDFFYRYFGFDGIHGALGPNKELKPALQYHYDGREGILSDVKADSVSRFFFGRKEYHNGFLDALLEARISSVLNNPNTMNKIWNLEDAGRFTALLGLKGAKGVFTPGRDLFGSKVRQIGLPMTGFYPNEAYEARLIAWAHRLAPKASVIDPLAHMNANGQLGNLHQGMLSGSKDLENLNFELYIFIGTIDQLSARLRAMNNFFPSSKAWMHGYNGTGQEMIPLTGQTNNAGKQVYAMGYTPLSFLHNSGEYIPPTSLKPHNISINDFISQSGKSTQDFRDKLHNVVEDEFSKTFATLRPSLGQVESKPNPIIGYYQEPLVGGRRYYGSKDEGYRDAARYREGYRTVPIYASDAESILKATKELNTIKAIKAMQKGDFTSPYRIRDGDASRTLRQMAKYSNYIDVLGRADVLPNTDALVASGVLKMHKTYDPRLDAVKTQFLDQIQYDLYHELFKTGSSGLKTGLTPIGERIFGLMTGARSKRDFQDIVTKENIHPESSIFDFRKFLEKDFNEFLFQDGGILRRRYDPMITNDVKEVMTPIMRLIPNYESPALKIMTGQAFEQNGEVITRLIDIENLVRIATEEMAGMGMRPFSYDKRTGRAIVDTDAIAYMESKGKDIRALSGWGPTKPVPAYLKDTLGHELAEMEKSFAKFNKEGAFYYFNNISNDAEKLRNNFKTIDDIRAYSSKRELYERQFGPYTPSQYYIPYGDVEANLEKMTNDEVKRLRGRALQSWYPNMKKATRYAAIAYAEDKALTGAGMGPAEKELTSKGKVTFSTMATYDNPSSDKRRAPRGVYYGDESDRPSSFRPGSAQKPVIPDDTTEEKAKKKIKDLHVQEYGRHYKQPSKVNITGVAARKLNESIFKEMGVALDENLRTTLDPKYMEVIDRTWASNLIKYRFRDGLKYGAGNIHTHPTLDPYFLSPIQSAPDITNALWRRQKIAGVKDPGGYQFFDSSGFRIDHNNLPALTSKKYRLFSLAHEKDVAPDISSREGAGAAGSAARKVLGSFYRAFDNVVPYLTNELGRTELSSFANYSRNFSDPRDLRDFRIGLNTLMQATKSNAPLIHHNLRHLSTAFDSMVEHMWFYDAETQKATKARYSPQIKDKTLYGPITPITRSMDRQYWATRKRQKTERQRINEKVMKNVAAEVLKYGKLDSKGRLQFDPKSMEKIFGKGDHGFERFKSDFHTIMDQPFEKYANAYMNETKAMQAMKTYLHLSQMQEQRFIDEQRGKKSKSESESKSESKSKSEETKPSKKGPRQLLMDKVIYDNRTSQILDEEYKARKKEFNKSRLRNIGRSYTREKFNKNMYKDILTPDMKKLYISKQFTSGKISPENYSKIMSGLRVDVDKVKQSLTTGRGAIASNSMALDQLAAKEMKNGSLSEKEAAEKSRLITALDEEIMAYQKNTEALNLHTMAEEQITAATRTRGLREKLMSGISAVPGKIMGGMSGLFSLMMNPTVMAAQMIWGYVQQAIEQIKQWEQEKISKLSEILSNSSSAFDEQQSTWQNEQAEADESFGELSDNEKQDRMLKAMEDARNDNNNASAQTRALLGKQNAMIKASDNLIDKKSDQLLTGFDGWQAKYTEFVEGSGMYGTEDEYGLTDRIFNQFSLLMSNNLIYDQDDTKNNTRRLDALAESAVQIDTRVKNMEEFTEDYQQVMASFGIANRNMLDIYNVRGILPDNFFDSTFFDPSSNQRIGAPGQRSAEQLASLMKQEEKIIRRFENRYLRFVRSGNGTGNRIQVTLGEGSIHSLATQLGVKDIEAAQMLAVHELQRIQDVMLNQVEPELAQTAISMYQGAYTLEENRSLNDVQATFQNTMTQGIFAIQAQVAQLVYKATMEEALADYQAATGDTDTDTIGLLLNRARDSGYKFNKEAKDYASQGWGAYMQARDVQKLVNQGYTQEEALKKLADEGKNGDWYKDTYAKELNKYSYNQNAPLEKLLRTYSFAMAPYVALTGYNPADPLIEAMSSNDYESFTKYTDWMMKSYAGNVPLDDAIKTLNEAQVAEDEEGDGGNKDKDKDNDDSSKQRYVQLAICNKKAIPKLNVNLFKKAPSFTVLNKNFKLRDIKINTADKAKNIENSLKNAIIEVQERSDPKIIQDSEGEYDPVGATDGDNLPTGASQTK